MAYRNWKQEMNDYRPARKARPRLGAAVGLAALTAAVCCVLWVWPALLRQDKPDAPASAEELYLAPSDAQP